MRWEKAICEFISLMIYKSILSKPLDVLDLILNRNVTISSVSLGRQKTFIDFFFTNSVGSIVVMGMFV